MRLHPVALAVVVACSAPAVAQEEDGAAAADDGDDTDDTDDDDGADDGADDADDGADEDDADPDPVVDDTPAAASDAVPATVEGAARPDDRPAAQVTSTATTTNPPTSTLDAPAAVDDRKPTTVDTASTAIGDSADPPPPPEPSPAAPPPPQRKTGFSFSGIPAINYIADNGLGLGAIVAAYYNDGVTLPYRTAITLQVFVSTNLVQDHNLVVDTLRVLDLPLRLTGRVGYISSLTQNYCGVGGNVSCDVGVARAAADERGLVDDDDDADDDFDRFVRHFYQRRFMNPYGLLNARYALIEQTATTPRIEVTGGYRGFYFIPGDVFADDDDDGAPDLTPYPGSLYARDFPDGEPGYDSVFNVGLMGDTRDNEPAPTSGWWHELSVRAATPLWLSTWTWAGFNVTLRGYQYLPLFPALEKRLVLANRLTFDGVVGDIPIQELARLGGSQDIYAFGGADMGRGIRVQRYLGKVKVLDQVELRYRFFEFAVLEQNFALTTAAFVDAGIIGDELINPKDIGTNGGFGGAFRVAWNENFMIRVDVAVSTVEDYATQLYNTINQPF
jgi:hypothetical protein